MEHRPCSLRHVGTWSGSRCGFRTAQAYYSLPSKARDLPCRSGISACLVEWPRELLTISMTTTISASRVKQTTWWRYRFRRSQTFGLLPDLTARTPDKSVLKSDRWKCWLGQLMGG